MASEEAEVVVAVVGAVEDEAVHAEALAADAEAKRSPRVGNQ